VSSGNSVEELVDAVIRMLEEDRHGELADLLRGLNPQRVYDLIMALSDEDRGELFAVMPVDVVAPLLPRLPDEVFVQFLSVRGVDELAKVIPSLPIDEAADVIMKIPAKQRMHVLRVLPRDLASEIEKLMKYPPESVGGVMTTRVPYFPSDMTVGEARKVYVEKDTRGLYDKHYYIYVVDSDGKLIGWIDTKSFLIKPPTTKLGECTRKPPAVVRAADDREVAARIAVQYDLMEVPVVDESGRFLGVVTLDDILDVVVSEFSEDLLKYGGMLEVLRGSYIAAKPWRIAFRRIPTIVYLYLMNMVTGSIVASFTSVIERVAVLAAFLPMLADNSGNIGSQASSLALRALILGEVRPSARDVARVLLKEFAVTTFMLAVLAPVAFAIGLAVTFMGGYTLVKAVPVATVVTAALAVSCYISDLIGFILPIGLAKLRVDPATASAPVITTIGDIVTASTYFLLAQYLLSFITA